MFRRLLAPSTGALGARVARAALAAPIALALGLAACSSSVSGSGTGATTSAPASSPPAATSASSPTGGADQSESGAGSTPAGTTTTSVATATVTNTTVVTAPPAPIIASLTTDVQNHCTQGNSQDPTISWVVVNATGVAVSVDDAGQVGTYGTYSGRTGTQTMPDIECAGNRGSVLHHRYDVWTVGGTGQAAHQTIFVSVKID